MKLFLSPAKRLQTDFSNEWGSLQTPKFIDEAKKIMQELREKSPQKLENLMGISSDIAEMNYERNQVWSSNPQEKLAAAQMFDGEVYRGLTDEKLSDAAKEYLKKNLYILSGLYGILSPHSTVMPYRLEMGTKLWDNKRLDQFWQEKLTDFVNQNTQKDEILLDLSSMEYMKSLNQKKLKGRVYDLKFMDFKNGKYKQITVYFKKARGAMARYCAENNIQNLDGIKAFNGMDYLFNDELSTEKTLVFTRR